MLAAIYIFLNKRSFNGNCKYNDDNLLNASFSQGKTKMNIYNEENIEDISDQLLLKIKILFTFCFKIKLL
jgi:site-specific DNA-adenine methylase